MPIFYRFLPFSSLCESEVLAVTLARVRRQHVLWLVCQNGSRRD